MKFPFCLQLLIARYEAPHSRNVQSGRIDAIEDPSSQRPADIFLPAFTDMRPTCLDIIIISLFTKSYASNEHLLDAEQLKINKYQQKCDNIDLTMMECFGKWLDISQKSQNNTISRTVDN